ncbi:putative dTDP-4-dehydrorhamnose reductase [uncultured Desulfatiglans sp.]|uniref:dTDP-4-dehydrorhamnose reductase n=1 Tax=Uncultured Desulfatiglans sp. TaxID=1748965 RepID=A0A653A8A2_UNCDX|nr:putative dTDP-4-dehydrorhamnose reductase [uncultured Desulfatiglans sp.]
MMKILLVGSTGMLGTACSRILGEDHAIVAPPSKELDMTRWDVVIETLDRVGPDIVINCAGYTDMEGCERDETLVRKINIEGPRNLAQGCARFECRLLHLSSDCVFDGRKETPQPYFEDDPPNPLSAYGKSKLDSEIAVKENVPAYIIVRSGWVYDLTSRGFLRNVIRQALESPGSVIQVPALEMGAPTWSYRLALQIRELVRSDSHGTYHATAEGCCTRLEYAQAVLDTLGLKAVLEERPPGNFTPPIELPVNRILENRRLKKQGIHVMADWKEDLEIFLNAYGEALMQDIRAEGRGGIAA